MGKAETNLNRAALSYLELRGILAWRTNTGAATFGTGTAKRFVRFGRPGISDIIGVLPDGRFLAAEAKVGKRVATDAQQNFIDEVNRLGGVGFVFYDLDELEEHLDNA